MSFFVVVRGPLGAGKTTVARALAAALGATYVSIDELLERYPWDGGSEELFLRTNADAAQEAQGALARGAPVVFDGNFYWPSALEDLERRLPYPRVVYALQVPLEICTDRDRRRTGSYGADATREVYEKVRPLAGEVPLDGTRSPEQIVTELKSDLDRRGMRTREGRQPTTTRRR